MHNKIISSDDIMATLGDIITRKAKGRCGRDEITIFDSTGLAIQDAALGFAVYTKAIQKKIGRWESFV